MTADIAIVGTGGIGQRHAQSCATLPETDYRLHLVEPNEESRARTGALLGERAGIFWYERIADLPRAIDLAIVATRADIRAAIIADLVMKTDVRLLVLEKVLFQRLDHYAAIGDLLSRAGASAWVNCPRRLWPGYRTLQKRLKDHVITDITVSGADWDIGCNAVHFLDLVAFLTDSRKVAVDSVDLGKIRAAKRSGMLHIEGVVTGHLIRDPNRVPFRIVSTPAHRGPITVSIDIGEGRVAITEDGTMMTINWLAEKKIDESIPFQSQTTGPAVVNILEFGRSGLASYDESRALHETFVASMLATLAREDRLTEPEVCPIT